MDSETRLDYEKNFNKIAERITELAYELGNNNKDTKEFASEMLRHIESLRIALESFNKA